MVWRDRVDAQDAYAAAAQAKAAALQRKEEAMAAKRTVLARLEAAIHALTAAENGSADAAETTRAAAADLDDHVEVCCHPSLLCFFQSSSGHTMLHVDSYPSELAVLLDFEG